MATHSSSCLENALERGAWRAIVCGVAKSQTRLSDTHHKQRLLFTCSVMSNSLWTHGLQHTRLPCPSLYPRVCSNSCPSSQWRSPTISSSVVPFSSCLQSFPTSGSFPMSWLFPSGGQSVGVSASVLPVNIQGWFPLRLTGLISLLSKGLSRLPTFNKYLEVTVVRKVWESADYSIRHCSL